MSFKMSGAGLASLAAGLLTSVCILFQWWLPLAAVLFGLPLVLFLISEPFKALIMWLLVSPALGSYIKLSLPIGVPDITFDRLVVGCVVLALILQVMFRSGRFLPAGRTEKTILLFVVVGLLDVFFRSQSKGSDFLIFFDQIGIPFLFFLAAKNLFRSNDHVNMLIRALSLLGLYVALYGIYQFLIHGGLDGAYGYDLESVGHLVEGRAVGPFENAAIYGILLNFAFLWAMYLLQFERPGLAKAFIIIGLGVIGVGILLSLTRSVWVGFFVSLFIVQLLDRKWRRPFVLCASGLVLLLFFVWFSPSQTSRISQRAGSEETVYQRLVAFRLALLMFLAKPIAGYGGGDETFIRERTKFLAEIDSPWASLGAEIGPAHNQYLSMLVSYGLIGLVLYCTIFFSMLRRGINLIRMLPHSRTAERQFAILFCAMIATHLVQGLFVDILAFPFVTNVMFIFAGALQALGSRAFPPDGFWLGRKGLAVNEHS